MLKIDSGGNDCGLFNARCRAGTAHAGWATIDECFDGLTDNNWYKLKKRNTKNWGVRHCNTRWCTWSWVVMDVSETKARNNIPCL